MKNHYFTIALLALSLFGTSRMALAQDYIPLLDNTSWTLTIANFGGSQVVQISNPVAIAQGGFAYESYNDPTVFGGGQIMLREDVAARKVYRRINSSDQLLYDFSLNLGEHIVLGNGYDYVVSSKDSVTVTTGRKRLRLHLLHQAGNIVLSSETWIESVGSPQHPLKPEYELPSDPYIYTICSYSGGLPAYNFGLANGGTTPTECNFLALKGWDSAAVQVYPNPATAQVTVRFADFQDNASILVRNVLGQIISSETNVQAIEKTIALDGCSGIYFIEIANGKNQKQVFKIIKE